MSVTVKRLGLRLLPESARIQIARRRWDRQNRQSELGYISHLRSGEWDRDEFALVGSRFVDQMVARYDDFGSVPAGQATVLEIGCGVGRFLRPLAERFGRVIGVDFSQDMLDDAARYCEGLTNVELVRNDGATLPVPDRSVDFIVSAGVFQHITVITAVYSYVREAMRVLRPGGLLLFQFEGNRGSEIGIGQVGAKITAAGLDAALADQPFRIREVSIDPRDPVRNVVCVLERTEAREGDTFVDHPPDERAWIIGVYDGISTDTEMHTRLAAPKLPLTFYE